MHNRYSARNPVFGDSYPGSRPTHDDSQPQLVTADPGLTSSDNSQQQHMSGQREESPQPTMSEQPRSIYLKPTDYTIDNTIQTGQQLSNSGLQMPRSGSNRSLHSDRSAGREDDHSATIHSSNVAVNADQVHNQGSLETQPQPQPQGQSFKVEIRKYQDFGIRNNTSALQQQSQPSVTDNKLNSVQPQQRPASRGPNSQNTIESIAPKQPLNDTIDTNQNLTAFMRDHINSQARDSNTNYAFNVFENPVPPPLNRNPSSRSLIHQSALNELSNDAATLKSQVLEKERQIRFLKEKLELLNESARASIRPKVTETNAQIHEFKLEQLHRNIKVQRNEAEYLKKQLARSKTEFDRISNENARKIYDMRINFDQETRALMEDKETLIVMNNLNTENNEVNSLVQRFRALMAAKESEKMKGFLGRRT